MLSGETGFETMDGLLNEDDGQAVWWGTWAECSVAVSRLKREGIVDDTAEEGARRVLDRLASDWMEVEPMDDLRLLASILSKDHPLQLAAALRWCEGDAAGKGFVCLDRTLCRAASDEGFDVSPEVEAG